VVSQAGSVWVLHMVVEVGRRRVKEVEKSGILVVLVTCAYGGVVGSVVGGDEVMSVGLVVKAVRCRRVVNRCEQSGIG